MWTNWLPTSSTRSGNPNFTSEAREERRAQLEANRLLKAQKRATRQQFYKAGVSAPPSPSLSQSATPIRSEADEDTFSLPDIFLIAEDIFGELLGEMEDFDVENGQDGEKAIEKLGGVQCPFSKSDIEFWFSQLETQLTLVEVKSQWLKRIAVQRFLPVEVQEEVRGLLTIKKTAAGNDIYKRIKAELIELFGQKPEDGYMRAKNRVLSGKPSQLGKALITDLCKKDVKLDGCCCDKIVWGMFRDALPIMIRNHIADMDFNKTTYKAVFQKADQVWDSNQVSEPVQARPVAAATVSTTQEVAAVQNKNQSQKKNKNKMNQNPSQGSQSQNHSQGQSQAKGQTKEKSEDLCRIHAKWKENANFCSAPWMCKMKNIYKAPQ